MIFIKSVFLSISGLRKKPKTACDSFSLYDDFRFGESLHNGILLPKKKKTVFFFTLAYKIPRLSLLAWRSKPQFPEEEKNQTSFSKFIPIPLLEPQIIPWWPVLLIFFLKNNREEKIRKQNMNSL